jgi:hypothetical protein
MERIDPKSMILQPYVKSFIMELLLSMILKIIGNYSYLILFSHVRRDKPCVHLIYGVDISVNAGNFMYFAPLRYLLKSGKFSPSQIVKMG